MKARDFCFWLQGYFELTHDDAPVNVNQKEIIKNHLNLVFKHEIDPAMGPKKHQDELNKIHDNNITLRC